MNKKGSSEDVHRARKPHLLGLGALAAWAMAVTVLLSTGNYRLYLFPGFWPFLVLALILLVFGFTARFGLGQGNHLDVRPMAAFLRTGLLLLPLVFLLGGFGESLGAFAFGKRQLMGRTGVAPVRGAELEKSIPGDQGVYELDLLRLAWNKFRLKGKEIITLGQVARDASAPENHFVIFRFVISCCVADAQPVAFLVFHEDQAGLAEDTWVRVRGRFDDQEGAETVLEASSVEVIREPRDIYLYAF